MSFTSLQVSISVNPYIGWSGFVNLIIFNSEHFWIFIIKSELFWIFHEKKPVWLKKWYYRIADPLILKWLLFIIHDHKDFSVSYKWVRSDEYLSMIVGYSWWDSECSISLKLKYSPHPYPQKKRNQKKHWSTIDLKNVYFFREYVDWSQKMVMKKGNSEE